MPRFFVSPIPMGVDTVTIDGEDARHISFSLRMRTGDEIVLCDGEGRDYLGTIREMDGKTVTLSLSAPQESATEMPHRVRLYQSVPKGDKFDYIVQKATELGVCEIVPVYSARCIVRPDEKSDGKRRERLNRIAREAAMQSGRGRIPTVSSPLSFAEAVAAAKNESSFICYENERALSLREFLGKIPDGAPDSAAVSFFVGPEGGYAPEEIRAAEAAGIAVVGLGSRILRAETASGFVLSCLCYEWEMQ